VLTPGGESIDMMRKQGGDPRSGGVADLCTRVYMR